ncbi:DNA/RNA non-specific endonuclease [Snodgrassella communis]|uniref:DNA/RNA non-specific endonuclease n=1 Tax=Snodgrassella communis TaxID=2946699 RepID=UPI0015D56443|nr:DNA/RNA non-specific endonuclease [Snodgrassella communis]
MARKANQERQQAREKAEQELQSNNPELWQDYNQLSEDKKQLVLRETSKDYRTADEQAQSWGIGGGKSRALNAVTSAVTGILGGQTNLQAATNALAPYAAELIGKQFGHGDNQNQAAQLVAHALLGAISASVNGGNAAAGAVGTSAAELAAQYLIKQLPKDQYPEAIDPRTGEIDPNRLPESVKASIRDLSSAVATVSGGLTGGSLVNAQIAGVVGQNAVENNLVGLMAQEMDRQAYETNLKKGHGWTDKQLEEYSEAKSIAIIKGAKQGVKDTIESIKQLAAHPIDSIAGIYDIVTNSSEVYNTLKISAQEWNELYNYALKTNPALAGEMEGYLVGKSIGAGYSGLVITGGAAQVVSKVAKLKYAGKVPAKADKGTSIDSKKIVDLNAGNKGNWNKLLNKPEPNTIYKVDGNKVYHTDELGRVSSVESDLNLLTKDRNNYQQCKVGRCGIEGDEGGHLLASIFNGPGEKLNLVPMNSNLNRGAWKQMENTWAKALKEGKNVKVKIEPAYSGNGVRPDSFKVHYTIDGKPKTIDFANSPGGK